MLFLGHGKKTSEENQLINRKAIQEQMKEKTNNRIDINRH